MVSVIAIVIAMALLLQVPQVQTGLTAIAIKKITGRFDADIRFEKVHLKPFTTLILKNIEIIDRAPAIDPVDSLATQVDTFFMADYILARFNPRTLISKDKAIHIDKVTIKGGKMNLVTESCPIDEEGDTTTVNLTRIFHIKKPTERTVNPKELFHIKKVEIQEFSFSLLNRSARKLEYRGGINWDDLHIDQINIKARQLRFEGGIMYGQADDISFRESTGFTARHISGSSVKVGGGRTIVNDLFMDDGMSEIRIPLFMMEYTCPEDFSDFIQKVSLYGDIRPSTLDFRTLWPFAPELYGNNLKLSLSGKVSGPVEAMKFENISASSRDGGFSILANGSMTGLPDIYSTVFDIRLRNANITSYGLEKFLSHWTPSGQSTELSKFGKGLIFNIVANGKGTLDALHVDADARSMAGNAKCDVLLENLLQKDKSIKISGNIRTKDLDAGRIIGKKIVGPVTLEAGLKANLGNRGQNEAAIQIDSMIVDRLHLNGYDYHGIAGAGELSESAFNGKIICNDPALNFLFQGTFALSSKTNNSLYKFYANIGHADLNAMNIDKRGKSEVQVQTSVNFTRTSEGNIFGKIEAKNLILENTAGKHNIGNISLTSLSADDVYRMKLSSRFADGSFSGSAPVTDFITDLKNITLKRELPALFAEPEFSWKGNNYSLSLKLHNTMDLLSFVCPGVYISDNTSLSAKIDNKGGFSLGFKSPRVAYKEQYFKTLEAKMDNQESHLSGEVNCEEIKISTLKLIENRLQIFADDNHIGTGLTYDNESEILGSGELIVHGDLQRSDKGVKMDVNLLPSTLNLNSREWNILPSEISILGKEIDVKKLEMESGEQHIRAYGRTSVSQRDTLSLDLDRFDISIINPLLGQDLGVRGSATGFVQLTSPLEDKGLLVDLICDSTYVSDIPLGELTAYSRWNDEFNRFDISISNEHKGERNISLDGRLYPKISRIEASADLNGFRVGCVKPLIEEIFSEMDGAVSGKVFLEGPYNDLSIRSEDVFLDNTMLRIAYTNVPYFANGAVSIDDTGVHFDDVSVKDSYIGTGKVEGSILWNHFKDIRFDTHISADQMQCIDLNESQSDVFYGNLSATGRVSITGPVNSIKLTADAATARTGELHIPISNTATSTGTTDLLKFKELKPEIVIDPYEQMMAKLTDKQKSQSNFDVSLHVTATPNVEAFVEIDKASGNVLSGRGNGTIDLDVGADLFNIKGDYTITSGKYKFVAMGLVSRDFQIQNGSTVNFNGDLMDSNLSIDAIYRTKASLSTLIADTSSVANRRTVDCGISITDKLTNPRLAFSINIPDLDPMYKSRVESALSTDDKIQKQFLSLLISNNFLPDEQSGIVNNTSVLYSNVSELMLNQVNNILQKLNIPLDLGLNYQPNEKGNDIFDVAVSTQLFNNRVILNGNIGNRQYSTSSGSNVAGDIEIEIKLDRQGAFRLNLFSHSADQYTNYLDNSQRNGVGVTYQTEFHTFGQFFKNMFSKKDKRRQAKMLQEQEILESDRKEIRIE